MNSKNPGHAIVSIITTVAGSARRSTTEIDVRGYPQGSLFYEAAQALARSSQLKPIQNTRAFSIKNAFRWLSDESREQLKASPLSFNRDSFHQFVAEMDTEIDQIENKNPGYKLQTSYFWHRFLTDTPAKLGDHSALEHALDGYRSPLRRLAGERRVRSSLYCQTFTNDLVSTIPHTSPAELMVEARKAVENRRGAIAKACIAEFELYKQICLEQETYRTVEIPEEARKHIYELISKEKNAGSSNHNKGRWYGYNHDWITAVALQYVEDQIDHLRIGQFSTYSDLRLPSLHVGYTVPHGKLYRYHNSLQPWFLARYRLPNRLLTSIFVFLLERTGWNPGALGKMTTDGIIRVGHSLTLQGFKNKTDDDTPNYEVARNDTWVQIAVVMLERNLEQLKNHKIVPSDEKRIWFGWQALGHDEIGNFIHFGTLRDFATDHELPFFSPKELRPLRAASIYLEDFDLKAVQSMLGHSSIDTVEDYLRGSILFHINEAKALQFQRTIEATLIFATRGEAGMISMKIDQKFVDPELLYPTGDGGVCKNPYDPPHEKSQKDQTCDGLRCHVNGGCPNYRLVVTDRTLELALRTRDFYRSRWQELIHRNETAFQRLHFPRIVFIHLLLILVAKRRPNLLRQALTLYKEGSKA
ncbi:hypothetical protein [Herbaspirillum sp. CAH-3]|uniref:hypothetical protein n=1 Tax=Herbaspirillum sp. CAH-3 TaxID=2605746 RepID=UPI0012AD0964|nr:hypothetical protein [Herbaspirillum sp. CAH-3]MRT30406.1 hypothetical protein [Herbaspirillum sp. CAH-3]